MGSYGGGGGGGGIAHILILNNDISDYSPPHGLKMELDLQSLFRLRVHSCTHWLRPRKHPHTPHLVNTKALLVSQDTVDDISLRPPASPLLFHSRLYRKIVREPEKEPEKPQRRDKVIKKQVLGKIAGGRTRETK
jgi:hypothetical protein